MINIKDLISELNSLADPIQAENLSRFFKTGKGQYGEGDLFLGIKVPVQRTLVKKYKSLTLTDALKLLKSKYHEHRLVALLLMVYRFERVADEVEQKDIFDAYLANVKYINNWDLVDLSAPNIVGGFLVSRKRDILYKLAVSKELWEKRISILATYAFIKRGEVKDTFAIADLLMKDKHDLIHKAVGWMLREAGKRVSEKEEKKYLETRYRSMPRTMLRYAIERFSEEDKAHFMSR
ncbi:MAG: DNA alkylation repair protein [Fibrobacteres bacterium]|nr:DNA alkylation repair protein [Fibrobacterota bacterium]